MESDRDSYKPGASEASRRTCASVSINLLCGFSFISKVLRHQGNKHHELIVDLRPHFLRLL